MSIEHSTVAHPAPRRSRDDWLKAALTRCMHGIDNVKVAPLAVDLGVTTGSFYWHFKDRRELLNALLEYWERTMTDAAIEALRRHPGPAVDRILSLMETVMKRGFARYDLAIVLWAQSNSQVASAFRRVVRKRFAFTTGLYSEAGFSKEQAETRARMTVVYMMGESTLAPDSMSRKVDNLRVMHAILTSPERTSTGQTRPRRIHDR